MDNNIVELMDANLLEVFNERDPQLRQAAIERTYSPDVRWEDEDRVVIGRDNLAARAQELIDDQLAGLSFTKSGPVHQTAGMGYLAWNIFAPGDDPAEASPLISGFDVALVENGVIARLFTVVTKTPATP